MDAELLVDSVTRWIEDLKDQDDQAADRLWQRYFKKLINEARKSLGDAPRRIADEEDVAISVFQALCIGASTGKFVELKDRDDLWKLLVVITRYKSADQVRHQAADKRGGTRVRGDSLVAAITGDDSNGFDEIMGGEPTPELLVALQDQKEQLMGGLTDAGQRQVVQLRLQGYSNDEIADSMKVSVRTVERKLNLIRKRWLRLLS
ncbi:MAG: ECF-type sigma factor [Planctomycetota bacterium]